LKPIAIDRVPTSAAWAQAIFSAGAVLAAIAMVWWQRNVTSTPIHAAAQLAASAIVPFLDQTIRGLQTVCAALAERISGT